MVSLSRDFNPSSSGGVFFSEASLNSTDSDTQYLLQPVIGHERLKQFTPLKTIFAAGLLLALSVIMEIIVITLVIVWPLDKEKCEPYFLTLYAHIVYWSFSFIFDFYFKRKHHESRIRGYLEFYQKTHQHSRIPFYITTIWNTMLLLVATLFHDQYGDLKSKCESHGFLTPMNYMCFIITMENIFMVPVILSYICKVSKFNKLQLCPDAQRDEWMASFIQDSYSAGEVGYREVDNHVTDLLEKQADLLRYLREQNTRLIQKVLILSTQLKEKHTPQIT